MFRLLVCVQSVNLAKGETTVERYGRKPKRKDRSHVLEAAQRRKLTIDANSSSNEPGQDN